jgi:UDP:flavonoid glycosyltransferase YjiC (YdhE family)
MRPMGELRKQVGLPPSTQNPIREGMLSPFGTLGWFSPIVGAPQIDWPARTEVTGFIHSDTAMAGPRDRALHDFLDAGEPPVVFTLGTSAVTIGGDFYRVSLEVARQGGWRAILLTGADERN